MATTQGRQTIPEPFPDLGAGTAGQASDPHPAGRIKHGESVQLIRMLAFASWFFAVSATIGATQYLGAPLYLINQDYYYAYMALTKESFGLLMITLTQWFSPTVVRVSGDKSVRGQLLLTKDGRLRTDFPERLIMIANHQLYTDWVYLWWIAYTNRMHGHVFIILKESLKYIPFIGPGIMFYGFIFMARNWVRDKPRLRHRLQKLKARHSGPMLGSQSLDPMWLMIFPEGTNLSGNTRKGSKKWADKQNIPDLRHQLLPRSTGLQYCLQELQGTVDWIYDCTVAYEGIPRGGYGQDYFTLRAAFFQGRPPKSVNMYWRRFATSSIPTSDPAEFELWLRQRWLEKDALLEDYVRNGRFPADEGHDPDGEPVINGSSGAKVAQGAGFIETSVRLARWYEIGHIFAILASFALTANIMAKLWNLVFYGSLVGKG
ncbi:MAG: hypothetical protein Q9191_003117 [Dirinaria sp. TL-2023a]